VTRVIADGIAAGKTKVTPGELVAKEVQPAGEAGEAGEAEEPVVEPELEPAAVAAEGGETE
jgi:hypothetical protein